MRKPREKVSSPLMNEMRQEVAKNVKERKNQEKMHTTRNTYIQHNTMVEYEREKVSSPLMNEMRQEVAKNVKERKNQEKMHTTRNTYSTTLW